MAFDIDIQGLDKIDFTYLLQTRRELMMGVAMLLVSAVLLFVAIIPQVRQAFSTYGSLRASQEDTKDLARKVSQLQQISSTPVVRRAEDVNRLLPSTKPLLELLGGLQVAASESQVSFEDVLLQPGLVATEGADIAAAVQQNTPRGTAYDTLDLELTVAGDLEDINRFFRAVERLAPFTSVTRMSLVETIDRGAGGQVVRIFSADMVISSYFFIKPITATLGAPLPAISQQQQALLEELDSYTFPDFENSEVNRQGGLEDLFGISRDQILPE